MTAFTDTDTKAEALATLNANFDEVNDKLTGASEVDLDIDEADVTTFKIGGVTVTPTAAELNFVDGVTSAIQTQLDAKALASSVTSSLALKANLAGGNTFTGAQVFPSGQALIAPVLGTPTSGTLTNCAGLPISTGLTGAGTGVLTALAVNIGSAGAFVAFNGALGTPSSGNLSNCTADGTNAVGFLHVPQNSQSTAYTAVLADAGKHLLHPSADTTARTFTIPANSSVAYPVGTSITFVNQASAGVITIAITTDTMRLAGAGTTGSRTLAANGIATALKLTSTEWIINGTGLT